MIEKYREILRAAKAKENLERIYRSFSQLDRMSIVLGNPSCDQDSFIGSHVLGLLEEKVPVVNLSRAIFSCKKDLLEILEMMGVACEDLVFLEKEARGWVLIRGREKIRVQDKKISATIVDHNVPEKEILENKNFSVEKIIDHHPILKMCDMYTCVSAMCIELAAGSCCSLIYREIKTKLEEKLRTDPEKCKVLLLLTIPILTDTSCLTRRTHTVDRKGVEELLKMAGVSMEEAEEMHRHLKKKKKCEDQIPSDMILQMDYKSFEYPPSHKGKTFGISSVKYPYDDWIKRDGKAKFLEAVGKFVQERSHEFFLINCKSKGVREFFVYRPPANDFVQTVLYSGKSPSQREVLGEKEIKVYRTDASLSRKIVAPHIYAYLDKR